MSSLGAKLRYVPPNAFTAASLLLGLASLTQSAAGQFQLAAWMILWGVLLDKLDGTAARLLKATSAFGVQADSFADFVVFGIAPAGLVYFRLRDAGGADWLVLVSAGAYVLGNGGRLARFNVSSPPMGDRIFYGIPTTMMGAIVASAYLTWDKYALDPSLLRALPLVLLAGAGLMVSTVKLPKFKPRKNVVVNVLQFGNAIVIYALTPLRLFPEYLLACGLLYVVIGAGYYAIWPPRPDEPEGDDAPRQAPAAS